VILDIFATARRPTRPFQVELAQLEYSLPRLKRMWTHLSRYKGGIGSEGLARSSLKRTGRLRHQAHPRPQGELGKVEDVASERSPPCGRGAVGLVGYTNAGKST